MVRNQLFNVIPASSLRNSGFLTSLWFPKSTLCLFLNMCLPSKPWCISSLIFTELAAVHSSSQGLAPAFCGVSSKHSCGWPVSLKEKAEAKDPGWVFLSKNPLHLAGLLWTERSRQDPCFRSLGETESCNLSSGHIPAFEAASPGKTFYSHESPETCTCYVSVWYVFYSKAISWTAPCGSLVFWRILNEWLKKIKFSSYKCIWKCPRYNFPLCLLAQQRLR